MRYQIVHLDSRAALEQRIAGGKGASLAWLLRNRFRVPPGFIITTSVFARLISELGLEAALAHGRPLEGELERARGSVLGWQMPEPLGRAIVEAYRRLGGSVAVRSSMMGEDSQTASFAGQLDTLLCISGEAELLEAVKRCWASLFNSRLWAYLETREPALGESGNLGGYPEDAVPPPELAMAVVVQRMVDARAAGVAFSADPVSGQRCVVIEAVRGLGDRLMQGVVQPARYVVDARQVLIEAVEPEPGEPVLDPQLVLGIAMLIRNVAALCLDPQDVEWAWDGRELHLLQCRPITSLVGRRIYSRRLTSDMAPGLIKPLVWSTNTVAMAHAVFKRIFDQLIGPCDADWPALVTRIHGRIYTDMTLLGELFERAGLPGNMAEFMARDENPERRRRRFDPAMVRLLPFAWRHMRLAGEISAFVAEHTQALASYHESDWAGTPREELLSQIDRLLRLHNGTQWYVWLSALNMMLRNRLVARIAGRRAPDVLPSDLLRGLAGLKALQPNIELQNLAMQARTLPEDDKRLLVEADAPAIRSRLLKTGTGRALLAAVDAFLDRYGFLSANGTDFALAPWAENPAQIWHGLGRQALGTGAPMEEDRLAVRRAAQERVRERLSPLEKVIFDRMLAGTIKYLNLREQTSMLMSQDSYQLRRLFLALADDLVRCGELGSRDDVFFLAYGDLQELARGRLPWPQAREKIRLERDALAAAVEIDLPDTIIGGHIPAAVGAARPSESHLGPVLGCLAGISGSSGVARGRAQVVLDPAEAPSSLTRDHILVVPFTDVGWTPLLPGIGGIVAETGGQLSHTAIIAREYGVPAVVSVKKATRLIRTGQMLTVHGDLGRVYLEA